MKTLPALALTALALVASTAGAGQIEIVDQVPAGSRSDTAGGTSVPLQLSTDGRYLLYVSAAANLIPGQRDENQGNDVFLYDRATGATTLVTHKAGASATAAGVSISPFRDAMMSPDGRWVAFGSPSGDVVAGQQSPPGGPPIWNLFLWDRTTGATTLVTHKAGAPLTGANGSYNSFQITNGGSLAFASYATDLLPSRNDANGDFDVFFWDRTSGKTTLISRTAKSATTAGNAVSQKPWASGDGRWIGFESQATNLLQGAPLPRGQRVFLHDRATGKSLLVSHASSSSSTPSLGLAGAPIVSAGGTFVLFASDATDLVAGQQGSPLANLFLFERATGKITLLSHSSASPLKAVGASGEYRMTPDGAWIAFTSPGLDLVAGQTNPGIGRSNLFLLERATGRLLLASRAAASPSTAADGDAYLSGLSADGRRVAFSTQAYNMLPAGGTDTNEAQDAFVFDRVTGQTTLISAAAPGKTGNGPSAAPVISADGSWIAYGSEATDLIAGKRDLNALSDVVLYERATARSRLVSLHPPAMPSLTPLGSSQAESVSADGRYSVFTSSAPNLVPGQQDGNDYYEDVFLYDHLLRKTTLVSRTAGSATTGGNGKAFLPRISADGRFVIYLSQSTNAVAGQADPNSETGGEVYGADLFLFDRVTETTALVSHAAGSLTTTGNERCREEAAISADGSWIVFTSLATDLADGQVPGTPYPSDNTYLYERSTGRITLLSHQYGSPGHAANGDSELAGLSADGNVVLLLSDATDLTSEAIFGNGINAWVLDRTTGLFTLASRTTSPSFPLALVEEALLSSDGGTVAFYSPNPNLVPGQTGDEDENLFLWDRQTKTTRLVSHAAGSAVITSTARRPAAISADGRWVVFQSFGRDLVPGQTDLNDGRDFFLYDRDSGTNLLVSHALGSATTTGNAAEGDQEPSISADGRLVAFINRSSNLTSGPAAPQPLDNLFVFDRTTGANTLVTRSSLYPDRAARGPFGSSNPRISADGKVLLFTSDAWDLVPGDFTIGFFGQSFPDVFLYTLP